MQVALLNNLRAGRSGKQVKRILDFLRAYPHVHHVETESAQALPDAILELARREVDLLVVNGGDGTLQHALTEILAHDAFDRVPLIAPLRGGRTNMTALDMGAQRNPVQGLKEVLEAAEAGRLEERVVERPVLRVQSARRGDAHYGMFFGAGMIHRAIHLTHRLFPAGRSQGVFGAGLVTGALIARNALSPKHPKDGVIRPDKAQVFLDGEAVPHAEYSLLIASSLRRLFLRMNPFWGKEPGGIRFTGISSDAWNKRSAAAGILRGRPKPFVLPQTGYTSKNAERAVLGFDCGFTVDGEIFPAETDEYVTITVDRRARFVRA